MLIGMLFAMAIVMLLYTGAATDDLLTAVAVYGGLIIGMIAAFWYSGRLSGGIANALLGGSSGKTDSTMARADAFVSERKYDEALEMYGLAAAKDKKNPTPRLKMADLYFKLRDYDNCIKLIEQAVHMRKRLSDDERCSRLNRLADIYLQQKRDGASAIKALELIVRDHPRSKYAVFARERIREIKK